MYSPTVTEAQMRFADIQRAWQFALLLWLAVVLIGGDSAVMLWLDHPRPRGFTATLKALSDAPLWLGYLTLLGAWALGYARGDRQLRRLGSAYVVTQLLMALLVQLLKMLVGRARPSLDGLDGTLYDATIAWNPGYHSFPSGHASDLMISAVFVAFLLPRVWQRLLCLLSAAALASLRVILVKHWPSDVLAGVALGGGAALLALQLFIRSPVLRRAQPQGVGRTVAAAKGGAGRSSTLHPGALGDRIQPHR